MEFFNPQTGQLDLVNAPDNVKLEVEQFNRKVITEDFNRVVCEAVAEYIDPSLPGKTLVFCVTDYHADIVVKELKQAFQNKYGSIEDEAVIKITGTADKPLQLIKKLRNEVNPKVAVTVDLLTTGIDVPSICNLVFIRRVNSRILYEQMLGRATRLCDDIGKEVFRIFDAVRLYEAIAPVSTMKPVVVNPNISLTQLVEELETVHTPENLEIVINQLLAKIQRQRKHLSPNSQEQLEAIAGIPLSNIVPHLKGSKPDQVKEWWKQRKAIAQILDRRDGGTQPILISRHSDELVGIEQSYGNAQRPQDYLESFKAFLTDNINQVPALIVVTQRPRELTRAQLKELRILLDAAGYTETNLKTAWRETNNQEIAASIIGYIRQATLGDALKPYSERVDQAINKVLSSRSWTPPQRQWLERIGKQIKAETIVDREALDKGAFKTHGGFNRLNQVFDGNLEGIITQIHENIWDVAG